METEHKRGGDQEGSDHALVLKVASEGLENGVREEPRDEPGGVSAGFVRNSLVLAKENKKLLHVEPYDRDRETN